MFRRLLSLSLTAFALIGCFDGDPAGNPAGLPDPARDAALEAPKPIDIKDLPKLLDIRQGDRSVTLYQALDGVTLLGETYPRGQGSLLTPEMEGWSWQRIQEKLAPGSLPAAGLDKLFYLAERGQASAVTMGSKEGATSDIPLRAPLAKSAATETWDEWFQANYCYGGNAFSWCLLNREFGNEWGWSSCKRSKAHIYLYRSGQVTWTIKVGTKLLLTTTVLYDYDNASSWTTLSGKDFWGYKKENHRYEITDASGDAFHWAVNADTW